MTDIILQKPLFLARESMPREWSTDAVMAQVVTTEVTYPEGQLFTGGVPTVAGGENLFNGLLLYETLMRPGEPQNLGLLRRFLGAVIDIRKLPTDLNGTAFDLTVLKNRITLLGGKPIEVDLQEVF